MERREASVRIAPALAKDLREVFVNCSADELGYDYEDDLPFPYLNMPIFCDPGKIDISAWEEALKHPQPLVFVPAREHPQDCTIRWIPPRVPLWSAPEDYPV